METPPERIRNHEAIADKFWNRSATVVVLIMAIGIFIESPVIIISFVIILAFMFTLRPADKSALEAHEEEVKKRP